MRVGHGWFGFLYSVFFTFWGIYQIATHRQAFGLILGIGLVTVGLLTGFLWWRQWLKVRGDDRSGRRP